MCSVDQQMNLIHLSALIQNHNLFNQWNCYNSLYVLQNIPYVWLKRKQHRILQKYFFEGNGSKIDIYDITSPFLLVIFFHSWSRVKFGETFTAFIEKVLKRDDRETDYFLMSFIPNLRSELSLSFLDLIYQFGMKVDTNY